MHLPNPVFGFVKLKSLIIRHLDSPRVHRQDFKRLFALAIRLTITKIIIANREALSSPRFITDHLELPVEASPPLFSLSFLFRSTSNSNANLHQFQSSRLFEQNIKFSWQKGTPSPILSVYCLASHPIWCLSFWSRPFPHFSKWGKNKGGGWRISAPLPCYHLLLVTRS